MLRQATPEEINFYETELYPLQDEVLSFINTEKLYLTGGTCLSRFYYQHRYSDDLDFFYDAYRFPKESFDAVCNELIIKITSKFQIEKSRDYDTFKRIIVKKDNIALKIEFVLEHLPTAAPLIKKNNFYIDSKINVGSNKITTVYHRKTARDYFDLFFLLKEYDLAELIKFAETKMVPLDYEGAMMALQSSAVYENQVIMIHEIPKEDFEAFITDLQRKLLNHARKIS